MPEGFLAGLVDSVVDSVVMAHAPSWEACTNLHAHDEAHCISAPAPIELDCFGDICSSSAYGWDEGWGDFCLSWPPVLNLSFPGNSFRDEHVATIDEYDLMERLTPFFKNRIEDAIDAALRHFASILQSLDEDLKRNEKKRALRRRLGRSRSTRRRRTSPAKLSRSRVRQMHRHGKRAPGSH